MEHNTALATMPALTGSPKQIAWAEKIRVELIEAITAANARPGNALRMQALAAITDSATLIDIFKGRNRGCIFPEDYETNPKAAAACAPIVAVAVARDKYRNVRIILVTRYRDYDGTLGALSVEGWGEYNTVAEALAPHHNSFQQVTLLACEEGQQ